MPPDFLVGRGPPHLRNVEKRFDLYRKFWRMFTDMKLWGHPVYLTKKQAITSLLDQREILPKCIVKVNQNDKLSKLYGTNTLFRISVSVTPTHLTYRM